jgi:hypothetical protein
MRRIASRAGGERREREGGADLGRRQRVEAEPRADDDPERAFGADKELRQVGSDRGAGRATGRHERAVGEDDVEAGPRCPSILP